jgi:hypothetical protein
MHQLYLTTNKSLRLKTSLPWCWAAVEANKIMDLVQLHRHGTPQAHSYAYIWYNQPRHIIQNQG